MKILGDLSPHPKNPRKISDPKLKMLNDSLHRFGDLSGFVFNVRTNRLVGGHQRQKVLPSDAQIHSTPLKNKSNVGTISAGYVLIEGERFAYREVDWDETTETAAMIAANQHGGEWDMKILPDLILEVDENNFAMDLLGFEGPELKDIMAPVGGIPVIEDELPKLQMVAKTQRGQIIKLGNHRLICGSATDAIDWGNLLDHKKLDLCFTSPPYNVGKSATLGANKSMGDSKYRSHDDGLSQENYLDFLKCFTENCIENVKCSIVNIQQLAGNKVAFIDYIHSFKNHLIDIGIWDKGHAAPAIAANVLTSRFEYLLFFSNEKDPSRAIPTADFRGTISNVYEGPPQRQNEFSELHSATFPLHLPSWAIQSFTKEGDTVIDPFGGTGTTLIAAEKLNRKCFMIELDPIYCDLIIKRWENLTGLQSEIC